MPQQPRRMMKTPPSAPIGLAAEVPSLKPIVPAQPVHQAEGKSREDVASGSASLTGPCKRIAGNGVDCVPELFAKAVRRRRVSGGVPVTPPAQRQGGI